MSRLSKENRRHLAKSILTRSPTTSDEWEYAVSQQWISMWRDNMRRIPNEDKSDVTLNQSNSDADEKVKRYSSDDSLVPISMSNTESENEYLPEAIWRMLASWFGIDPNNLLRRRPIYFSYMNLDPTRDELRGDFVVADKELDFVPVWVGDINDIMKDKFQNVIEVFAWESFQHITKQAIRSLEITLSSPSKIRIWFGLKKIDTDLIIEPILEGKQMLITKLIELMPEVKHLMKTRSSKQINKKYLDPKSSQHENSMERRPLGEEIFATFSDQVTQLCIGIEVVGSHERVEDLYTGIDGQEPESIMIISSVKNEWEDVLTRTLDQYKDSSVQASKVLLEQLATSAKDIVNEKVEELNDLKTDYNTRYSALEERENAARIKENENNEKEMELRVKLEKFKKESDDFQWQKHKFVEDMKLIEEQNKISESSITLNIGGIIYITSLQTLTRKGDSLLALMFSGKYALKREPDGTYFIDRDGLNFRYVLNYLRDGSDSVDAVPNEEKIVREIIREAKYYRLLEFETLLHNKLSSKHV